MGLLSDRPLDNMAIAFDAASSAFQTGGTSLSHSHTCTGSNLILIVFVWRVDANTDVITGVTYNSVAMTQIANFTNTTERMYGFYLINPSTGANNVVVSSSSSTRWAQLAASYTGVKQSGQPDAYTTKSETSGVTSISNTITTIADNCWSVVGGGDTSGTVLDASTNITSRTTTSNIARLGDSNGAITPAGNLTQTFTSGISQRLSMMQVSISPAISASSTGPSFLINFV